MSASLVGSEMCIRDRCVGAGGGAPQRGATEMATGGTRRWCAGAPGGRGCRVGGRTLHHAGAATAV
eukprot:10917580-Alexandrium_andersonii.AAC.1